MNNIDTSRALTSDCLIDQIEAIAQLYSDHYAQLNDLKALQGLERCIELKIKIRSLLDTPQLDQKSVTTESIPIVDLPQELLENLINHLNKTKMQQQIQ